MALPPPLLAGAVRPVEREGAGRLEERAGATDRFPERPEKELPVLLDLGALLLRPEERLGATLERWVVRDLLVALGALLLRPVERVGATLDRCVVRGLVVTLGALLLRPVDRPVVTVGRPAVRGLVVTVTEPSLVARVL